MKPYPTKTARKTQGPYRFLVPAKINPFLQILSRRADGYHEVRLAMAAISLYDQLEIELADSPGVSLRVESPQPLGPAQNNLATRAAQLFFKESGAPGGARLGLRKHIPAGAGLGGGSADAAATLMALNLLLEEPLAPATLHRLAASLGADVPFFLDCRPALAQGVGERLTPLAPFPRLELLVAKPAFSIATATAYQAAKPALRPQPPPGGFESAAQLMEAMENDFEAALFPLYPELARHKQALLNAGAQAALLSGSGSALWGVFPSAQAAGLAAQRLSGQGLELFVCHSLNGHAYTPQPGPGL